MHDGNVVGGDDVQAVICANGQSKQNEGNFRMMDAFPLAIQVGAIRYVRFFAGFRWFERLTHHNADVDCNFIALKTTPAQPEDVIN